MIAIAVFSFFIIFIIFLIAPGQLLTLLGIAQKAYAMISSVSSSPVNPFQCFCCLFYLHDNCSMATKFYSPLSPHPNSQSVLCALIMMIKEFSHSFALMCLLN